MSGTRITSMEMKDRSPEMFFTVNDKSKYKIPSKMFPLSSKKNWALFSSENTVPYNNEEFISLLDKVDLPIGRCYSNSEKILKIGETLNLDITYASGWIFRAGDMPKHHAWVMVKNEEGVSIIDSFKEYLFSEASKRYKVDESKPNWREEAAKSVKKTLRDMPLNSQQIVLGRAPESLFYVGSPDTRENAIKIFNRLQSQFPHHPSYATSGANMFGRSVMQSELNKFGVE